MRVATVTAAAGYCLELGPRKCYSLNKRGAQMWDEFAKTCNTVLYGLYS